MPELLVWLCLFTLLCLAFVRGVSVYKVIVLVAFLAGVAWILLEEHL